MPETLTAGDPGTDYADPVRRLLTIGESRPYPADNWPDYYPADNWPDYVVEYGLTDGHGPELLRMISDQALATANSDGPLVWAQVHAWRALGQLRLAAAIGPLLDSLKREDTGADETAATELPIVFGMIGPAAIPLIAEFLSDPAIRTIPAATAMDGLKEIAARHPESRSACIDVLTQTLRTHVDTRESVAGFAVSDLIDMRAVEAIDPIREAFRNDAVDISIAGDVEDVEIGLGLRQQRASPAPNYLGQCASLFGRLDRALPPEPDQAQIGSHKIGRNDPCLCGSGKKYKKCCMP